MLSLWQDPVVLGADPTPAAVLPGATGLSFTERMMLCDTVGYLPNDILTKVDRASMAVSLESRVPMLDPNVYRLAWQLPLEYKAHAGEGKLVLRKALGRHLPVDSFERPKMGFGIPLDSWLRNELRDWAEDLLDPTAMRNDGFLDVELVRSRWDQHQSGVRNWHYLLWSVLMFQSWLRHYAVTPAVA
jgi:asparagine synthase (glutamine-hydrolysing)